MRRITWLGTFLLLTAGWAPLRSSADTPLQENFDSYAIDAELPVGSWLWTLDNVLPANGTAKIQNSLILPATGNKALEITDVSVASDSTMRIYLSSTDLENRNGANGIQKGTVQIDYVSKAANINQWHSIRLVDDQAAPGGTPADNDTICTVIFTASGAIRLQTRNAANTANINTDSPAYSLNTPYRFLFTFDKSDRSLTVVVKDGATFDNTFVTVTGCFRSSDAGFKGLRDIWICGGSTNTPMFQLDNIIVTDTGASGVKDWRSLD